MYKSNAKNTNFKHLISNSNSLDFLSIETTKIYSNSCNANLIPNRFPQLRQLTMIMYVEHVNIP